MDMFSALLYIYLTVTSFDVYKMTLVLIQNGLFKHIVKVKTFRGFFSGVKNFGFCNL